MGVRNIASLRDLFVSIGWNIDDKALRRADKETDKYLNTVEGVNKEISELEKDLSSASKQGQREFSNMGKSAGEFDSAIENIQDPQIDGRQATNTLDGLGADVHTLDDYIARMRDPDISGDQASSELEDVQSEAMTLDQYIESVRNPNISGTQASNELNDIGVDVQTLDSYIAGLRDPNISGAQPTRELDDVETEAEQAGSEIRSMPDPNIDGSQAERELQGIEDKAGEVKNVIAGIGGALGGGAIGSDITSFAQVPRELQAQLGITASEAESLSTEVEDVFVSTGASIVESTEAITEVNRRFNATGNHAGELAEDMTLLSQQTGTGVGEITQAADQLESRFDDVESPQEAMDMMTEASQRLSAEGFSELIDQVGEYGGAISRAGISGNDFFGSMIGAGEESTYVMDRLGDSLSTEFIPRLQSGDEAMMDALATMSGSEEQARDWQNALNEGGESGRQAVEEVLTSFTDLDQEQQNVLATDVFGSMVEDQPQIIEYMNDMVGETEDVGVATDDLKVRQDGMLNSAKEGFRDLRTEYSQFSDALGGLGEVIGGLGGAFAGVAAYAGSSLLGRMFGGSSKGGGSNNKGGGKGGGLSALFSSGSGNSRRNSGGGTKKLTKVLDTTSKGLRATRNPWAMAISLAPMAISYGIQFSDYLTSDLIPTVDDFGENVSDATNEAVLGYKNLNDEATTQLNQLMWSSQELTPQIAENIAGTFDQMGNQVIQSMQADSEQSYGILSDFFTNTNRISAEEEAGILENIETGNARRQEKIQEGTDRINEILAEASQRDIGILDHEKQEIDLIQTDMANRAVETLSQSEVEQRAIMERLNNASETITAQQAANTVENSLKAKNGAVEQANQRYDQVLQATIRERDETGEITDEQADIIMENAKSTRDETVNEAEDMHYEVVQQAQEQASAHVSEVNWETGSVMSGWDRMYNGIAEVWNWIAQFIPGMGEMDERGVYQPSERQQKLSTSISAYEDGTINGDHPGGLALLNDAVGSDYKELVATPDGQMFIPKQRNTLMDLPRGAEVLNGDDTKNFMSAMNVPAYEEGTDSTGIFSTVLDWISDGAEAVWNNTLGRFNFFGNYSMPDWFVSIDTIMDAIGGHAIDTIGGFIDDLFSFGGDNSYNVGSSVQQWSPLAAQALMMTGNYSTSNLNRMLMQMQTESGGNPNAINLWDINAQRGTPSMGLMQVIPPTFSAYAQPGHNDIWSPLDNMLASINYTEARYGSLAAGWRGVGYADGGDVPTGQTILTGEEGFEIAETQDGETFVLGSGGPQLANVPGGTRIHDHNDSQRMMAGNTTNNITINVQGGNNPQETAQAVRDEIEKFFGSMNRIMPQTQEL